MAITTLLQLFVPINHLGIDFNAVEMTSTEEDSTESTSHSSQGVSYFTTQLPPKDKVDLVIAFFGQLGLNH